MHTWLMLPTATRGESRGEPLAQPRRFPTRAAALDAARDLEFGGTVACFVGAMSAELTRADWDCLELADGTIVTRIATFRTVNWAVFGSGMRIGDRLPEITL